ncbi:phosphatidylglycerophosphatase A family protein [Aquabacterium fontiphilum]|jgi:phosphatidylglycerophosphatase A|uniref:phosphatidylglycerophosphatase A family protein n=1 Tax=Aquabacterium fontiphilum TaxID=450365 RepID=UPI001F2C993A|nr:phosphatidylglycerophosphatase A [Aquabacterium fontiphilum]
MNAGSDGSAGPMAVAAPRRASVRLLLSRPAHFISLGAGSGLSPIAPGTVGTLWGWLTFVALQDAWGRAPASDGYWLVLLAAGWIVGWWACTRTAQTMGVADPGSIVWDEIWAIWLILWLTSPVDWKGQLLAVVTFRAFDAIKPGPVAWADGLFKARPGEPIGWRQGLGIMFDDLVAAGCTLMVLALAVAWRHGGPPVGLLG